MLKRGISAFDGNWIMFMNLIK